MSEWELLKDKPLPGGVKRLLFRFPILLYKIGLGPLLGGRFLKLTHTGRKSGLLRETVLEVVKHDRQTGTYYIASGWGEKSNWLLNIIENPSVEVQTGRRSFRAYAKRLSPEDASSVLYDYGKRYPKAFAILTGNILGERLGVSLESARRMADQVPVIALEPRARTSGGSPQAIAAVSHFMKG